MDCRHCGFQLVGDWCARCCDYQLIGPRHVRLNLGCCDDILDGYVNVDRTAGVGVLQADLSRAPWPWRDHSIWFIRAHDIFEHLPDRIQTMNEAWRVLVADGLLEIALPTTDGPGAWQDPTHVSYWNERSFLYFEDGNPYRERFARHYGTLARFLTVRSHREDSEDGPRLTVLLRAVKA
jgi:SAM-dependent methyltransferase